MTVLTIALALAAGCGSGNAATVSGTVRMDGQPLDTGNVSFYPEGGQGAPAYGSIDAQGRYALSTGTQSGLTPGKYVALVVANVDAAPVTDPDGIRARLLAQLTAPVRWTACVERLRELGAARLVEPGPGAVLTGLLRRIDKGLAGQAVGGPDEVETLAAA